MDIERNCAGVTVEQFDDIELTGCNWHCVGCTTNHGRPAEKGLCHGSPARSRLAVFRLDGDMRGAGCVRGDGGPARGAHRQGAAGGSGGETAGRLSPSQTRNWVNGCWGSEPGLASEVPAPTGNPSTTPATETWLTLQPCILRITKNLQNLRIFLGTKG